MTSIAHVGHGYWGKNLARNFFELGHLTAVIDPDRRAAERAADAYGVRAIDFDSALKASDIDAVSLATPAGLHYQQAKRALKAGKHVFVEKPLALNIDEASELCELSEARGLTLMVGHLLQYHAAYIKLRQIVSSGELGNLLHVYSNRLSLGKFRTEENVLWSFAPHDISMILGLAGEPNYVTAHGIAAYTPGIADLVGVQMGFAQGCTAHVLVSWMHPFKEQRLVVICDNGMAVFEDSQSDWSKKLCIFRHRIDVTGLVPDPIKADPEYVIVDPTEPLREECRHFIQCTQTGEQPRTNGREGLRVLRVLHSAEQSLQATVQKSRAPGDTE